MIPAEREGDEMEKTVRYQHPGKHVRTFVVGALPCETGGFQPYIKEDAGSWFEWTQIQTFKAAEEAIRIARERLDEEMDGQEYEPLLDEDQKA